MDKSLILLAIIVAALVIARRMEHRTTHSQMGRVREPLDQPLLHWSHTDPFRVRDLLNGGVCITGRSGSGKTSSSGKELGHAILRYPKTGGLILAAKPEDLFMWESMFEQAGRKDDLIVFSPE